MWVYEFLHVLVGILWIGLLYFFNLVQVQSMPQMTEAGAAKPYTQIILPRALFLFRWAALLTVVTGIAYYIAGRGTVDAQDRLGAAGRQHRRQRARAPQLCRARQLRVAQHQRH